MLAWILIISSVAGGVVVGLWLAQTFRLVLHYIRANRGKGPLTYEQWKEIHPDWPVLSLLGKAMNGWEPDSQLIGLLMGIRIAQTQQEWAKRAILEYITHDDAALPPNSFIRLIIGKEPLGIPLADMEDAEMKIIIDELTDNISSGGLD